MSNRTNQIIGGIIILIIGLLLGWWIASIRYHSEEMAGMDMGTTTDMTGSGYDAGSADTDTNADMPSSTGTTQTTPSSTTTSGSNPTTMAPSDMVSVSNQSAGSAVMVSSVTLAQPGWVAVRDSNGITLGAAWFPAGTETNVSVPLLQATNGSSTYQVLLYADNGNHEFDLHTDTLIENADGSVAGTTFSTN